MTPCAYVLHALSPLHAGVGQAAELIDLPIARMKGTGIPFLPGSSIKGVLRDARSGVQSNDDKVQAVFGPDRDNAGKHAGALTCTDARLLALPVRSFRGTFAYVTCPLLLTLAARDVASPPPIPAVPAGRIIADSGLTYQGKVYLDDLDLGVLPADAGAQAWLQRIASALGDARTIFERRFAIVDDETMTFLWETATQLDQRVRIDPDTGTVATRALWLEESLPPETLLIGELLAEPSRHPTLRLTPDQVLAAAFTNGEALQFGGKSTIGRGRCRMLKL